jgi:hypothetical protein
MKVITSTQSIWQRMKRKQLILPTEHGSWSWLLVPFAVGVIVGGQLSLAVCLTLIGGLSFFLMRQPATVLYRVRRKRARSRDAAPAVGWLVVLGIAALLALVGLLILERGVLLLLLLPLSAVFAFYLFASRRGRAGVRSLGMELAGAIALAAMAAAALIAAEGVVSTTAWMLWTVMALVNGLGAIYVRLRITDTYQRHTHRLFVVWMHVMGLVLVVIFVVMELIVWTTAVPFILLLGRAVWVAQKPRPVAHIKAFGFLELGIELVSGVWIALLW